MGEYLFSDTQTQTIEDPKVNPEPLKRANHADTSLQMMPTWPTLDPKIYRHDLFLGYFVGCVNNGPLLGPHVKRAQIWGARKEPYFDNFPSLVEVNKEERNMRSLLHLVCMPVWSRAEALPFWG